MKPLVSSALRILQLTDIHLDPHYRPASSLLSFCHRSAVEEFDFERAGEYGAHGCDTPPWLLERALDQIKDLNLIIVSGDVVRHNYDDLSPLTAEEIKQTHEKVKSLFQDHFPSTPVIFSVGNNDVSAHDSLDSGPNEDLSGLGKAWGIEEESFLIGGFYSTDLNEQLSVISLNTLFFSKENVFARDCKHQKSIGAWHLKWLKEQFHRLEVKKRKALLVGHIPATAQFYHESCWLEYNRLLYQYRHSLIVQLFGHVHQDTLFVSQHQGIPSIPALTAPALSPVFNPAYRILHLDQAAGKLHSYQQFYAPHDFSHFQQEYDTTQVFPETEAIDSNFILKIERNADISSETKLMMNRFRYVCY